MNDILEKKSNVIDRELELKKKYRVEKFDLTKTDDLTEYLKSTNFLKEIKAHLDVEKNAIKKEETEKLKELNDLLAPKKESRDFLKKEYDGLNKKIEAFKVLYKVKPILK